MGAKNPTDIEVISAVQPINIGKIAPPTIDITIKEAPSLVFSPRSLIPNANMVGNMIDIKKKIKKRAMIEAKPSFKLTMGNSKQHMSE